VVRKYIDPDNPDLGPELPVIDDNDLAMTDWEYGVANDGDLIVQCWCRNCDEAHWLKLPLGAIIANTSSGPLIAGVTFGGPMEDAPKDIVGEQ